jgi:hypothetical protein
MLSQVFHGHQTVICLLGELQHVRENPTVLIGLKSDSLSRL